jgi:hypothetical protein
MFNSRLFLYIYLVAEKFASVTLAFQLPASAIRPLRELLHQIPSAQLDHVAEQCPALAHELLHTLGADGQIDAFEMALATRWLALCPSVAFPVGLTAAEQACMMGVPAAPRYHRALVFF